MTNETAPKPKSCSECIDYRICLVSDQIDTKVLLEPNARPVVLIQYLVAWRKAHLNVES